MALTIREIFRDAQLHAIQTEEKLVRGEINEEEKTKKLNDFAVASIDRIEQLAYDFFKKRK